MKIFQINSSVILLADGFISARTKKEAIEKWKKFVQGETRGLSFAECKVTDVFKEGDDNFDSSNLPAAKDFDNRFNAYTRSHLN